METDATAPPITDGHEARVPRAGRRQGRRATPDGGENQTPLGSSGPLSSPDIGGADPAPDRAEDNSFGQEAPDGRNKGWGADSASAVGDDGDQKFSGISRRKAQQMQDEAQQDKTSGLRNRWKHEADADAETILEIPELDGDNEEDMAFQVAEAPRARNNRMQTMAELDNDQQYNLPSNNDIDVDLSLLTSVLCSSEQVEEDDNIWEPDILFTDVASELTIEAEASEAENVDDGAT